MFVASLPEGWDEDFLDKRRLWDEYTRRFKLLTQKGESGTSGADSSGGTGG
jgi:hypothetical protein